MVKVLTPGPHKGGDWMLMADIQAILWHPTLLDRPFIFSNPLFSILTHHTTVVLALFLSSVVFES